MNLFPIGSITPGSSSGTIDAVSYTFFEPNANVLSKTVYNILQTRYSEQTILTREKSSPYLVISFDYADIFDKEYRQIEHFVESKDSSLSSFFCPDLSRGYTPSTIASVLGDWVASIPNTRLFSSINKKKSHYGFLWNGTGKFRIAPIDNVATNTSVKLDMSASNLGGSLSLTEARSSAILYPLYQVYFNDNPLQEFTPTNFISEALNLSSDGGWMRSGSISFISKYKV